MPQDFVIKADMQRLSKVLIRQLAVTGLYGLGLVLTYYWIHISKWWALGFAFLLPQGLLSAYWASYFLGLFLRRKKYLAFSVDSIGDRMSTLAVGRIQRRELRKVRVINRVFLGRCLEVRLKHTADCWEARAAGNDLRARLDDAYRLVFGTSLYVPINILAVSFEELRQHISLLKRHDPHTGSGLMINTGSWPVEPIGEIDGDEPRPPASESAAREKPQSASAVSPIKIQSLHLVECYNSLMVAISVRQSTPQMLEIEDLVDVRHSSEDGLDRLDGMWRQMPFSFVRDMRSEDDIVTFTVYIGGQEMARLKLQLEIGTFEYLNTEFFFAGPWLKPWEELTAKLQMALRPQLRKA